MRDSRVKLFHGVAADSRLEVVREESGLAGPPARVKRRGCPKGGWPNKKSKGELIVALTPTEASDKKEPVEVAVSLPSLAVVSSVRRRG